MAAGNDSDDANNHEPAHVEHPNVYTISAIDQNDEFAWFSNWGNPPVDYAAPGVNILSTQKGGGVTSLSGTSMAAPHACGVLLVSTPISNGESYDSDGTAYPIIHR